MGIQLPALAAGVGISVGLGSQAFQLGTDSILAMKTLTRFLAGCHVSFSTNSFP